MTCEPSQPENIGVIGLGLMGTAITERLLQFGFQPIVWNRTQAKATPLIQQGAKWSDNPFTHCRRILISLYDSQAVAEVLASFDASLQNSHILIDTTTGDPHQCQATASRLANRQITYLDAPISGSSEQTRQGAAMVMVGCDEPTFLANQDLWRVLAGQAFHTGPCGSASRMKLVSNLILGLNRAALAEGLAFADNLGIKLPVALEILQQSAAYSRVMDTKGHKMLNQDFSPQAKLAQHYKDVQLILQTANTSSLHLPLSSLHAQMLNYLIENGQGELDNCAIYNYYKK